MAGSNQNSELARLLAGPSDNGLKRPAGLRRGSLTESAGLFPPAPPTNALGLLGLLAEPKKEPRTYPCFEFYSDRKGEWRWRYLATNHKTIADSSESYHNLEDAKHGMELMQGCAKSLYYIGDE